VQLEGRRGLDDSPARVSVRVRGRGRGRVRVRVTRARLLRVSREGAPVADLDGDVDLALDVPHEVVLARLQEI